MTMPKIRRSQAERVRDSENALYGATIKLIARVGPSKMTVADIGREAGLSPAQVTHRFGSKSNLLYATVRRILELWVEELTQPVIAEDGLQRLETAGHIYLKAITHRSDLLLAQARLTVESHSSYAELQPVIREFNQQARETTVHLLTPLQAKGEIDAEVDLESFAIMYLGMMRGVASQYLVDSQNVDLNAVYDFIKIACRKVLLNESRK
ncbi:MAG: TetR family transcriptional regulator [Chloroflexota bacterium]|nr:TetR family transcriptional regulator [Chloroflexota bacterium]